ncbi:MAG TPA: EAL domain-containing protein [Candidatus Saccharimonadia bacterium]|nr:EAL domain-containing protein [Candidatus Saccharimonadia bacterium]
MTLEDNASSVTEEESRLAALVRYDVVDTAPEVEFDEIVRLAAVICATPIATITLVDEDRQWFKAKLGLDIDETPRNVAFCAHTILGRDPLIVPDAKLDPLFADNELVLGPPHLRFYAGFPLLSRDGLAVGTLTVMDRVPRTLTAEQRFAMGVLAHQVVTRLELRANLAELQHARRELLAATGALEDRVQARTRMLEKASEAQAQAESLYRSLWETTTDAVLILDVDSVIRYANSSTERIFGHAPSDVVGQPLSKLQPPALRRAHDHGLKRYLDTGVKRIDWRATEAVGLHAAGHEVAIEIAFSEVVLQKQCYFVGFIRDITQRKQAEAALKAEKERAQATLRSIGDGVVATDGAGRIAYLNPMAERLTGFDHVAALGRPHAEVLRLLDEGAGLPIDIDALANAREGMPAMLPGTAMLQRRTGERFSVEGSVAGLPPRNGQPAGKVVAFRDVSLARELTARISHQASHDSLTGLMNRAEFDRRLRVALDQAAEHQQHYSLLYLDLDQFKVVNDTCGHVAGDELLKQLATLLSLSTRGSDTIARLGGDEFGVLLDNCEAGPALHIAEKLRVAVSDFAFVWDGNVIPTTVSIGHVHFCDHALTLAEILSKADEACYVAKDEGRNRIHSYRPGDVALARRHGEMEWVQLIHRALEHDRFVLHAQPIFSVPEPDRQPTHFEILLRMQDDAGGLVPPMAFIPAAERYNLMPTIDRWVIRNVFARIAKRDTGGACECHTINLSATSLADAALPAFIAEQFALTGIDPAGICFEITETAAIANLAGAVKLIDEVKRLGCRFALDDFGSGMSSFTYLKHLPVDYLKIDGSFVREIASDPVDRAMVKSINEIGHLLGLCTVAEHVEDAGILEELRRLGVDYVQGYGLARPAPFEARRAGEP